MKITLSALIHGESGIGKSWFGDTAPAPRLIIDLEGRAKYTPSGPKVWWDPRQAPPVYDGTWNTCVVSCPDFDTLQTVYTWLRSGKHPFISVVVDSLMEAQKRCIDVVAGMNALDQQDWGTLLRKLEALVRSYRDLLLYPENPVQCVVFIVGSRQNDKTGKQEPLLQGQLRDTVPYYIDLVGYLHKQPVAEVPGTYQRSLLIDNLPGFVAKDGTGRLVQAFGPIVPLRDNEQHLTQLMQYLVPSDQPAQAIPTAAVPQEVAPV